MDRTTEASDTLAEHDRSYVDWSAILAGAVVATAIGAIFTGFGAALGLSALSAEPGEGSFKLSLILSAIWLVLTLVASYMAGGYIAGRMRRRVNDAKPDEVTVRDGVNGLVVWGVGTILGAMLIANALSATATAVGSAAGAAGSAVGTAVQAAGSAAGGLAEGVIAAAGQMMPDAAMSDPVAYVSDSLLRPATVNGTVTDTGTVAAQTASILGNVLATGEISDAERTYLESATAAQTGLPPAEAKTRVDQAVTAAQEARATAEKTAADAKAEADRLAEEAKALAIKAGETARVSAILSAFLLASAALVAAAASYIGAVRGGRHRDEGKIFGGFAYRG